MESSVRRVLEEKGSLVHVTEAGAAVVDAVELMNRKGIGALLVVDGGRPVGMFTERDVLTRVVAAAREPRTTRVGEVMTRELIAVGPETTVEEAMQVVTEKRCRHLPVMEDGALLGMVSSGDLTRWVTKDLVKDVEDLFRYIHGPYSSDGGRDLEYVASLRPSMSARDEHPPRPTGG